MTLNLNPIASTVERYMMDQVRVYRVTDQDFDDQDGEYTDIQVDLYEGKAFVATNATPARSMVGEDPVGTAQYEIGIPLSVIEEVKPLDYVEVIYSLYDPQLVGKILRVIGTNVSTFSVHRRIQATLDVSAHER